MASRGGHLSDEISDCHGLYQPRFAEYFSSMNPLARRIYGDIKKVENSCEKFSTFSHEQKCAFIDKQLLSTSIAQDGQSKGCHRGQSDTHALDLLHAVTPRHAYGEDDYPLQFTSSNADNATTACDLLQLVRKATRNASRLQHQQRSSIIKKKAPAPAHPAIMHDYDFQDKDPFVLISDDHIRVELKDKGKYQPLPQRQLIADEDATDNGAPKFLTKVEDHCNEDLPNQKQNSDLIAELQAKLKRNTSHLKQVKPKAPPPPPPTQASDNDGTPKSQLRRLKATNKEEGRQREDFVVDVSSPCRNVTPKTGFDFLDNW